MEVVVCRLSGVSWMVVGDTFFVSIEHIEEFKQAHKYLEYASLNCQ